MEAVGVLGFLAAAMLSVSGNSQESGPAITLQCRCADQSTCDPENFFCKSGCESGWSGPGCQIGNISWKKKSSQSSTYMAQDGPREGMTAAYAVDGTWPSEQKTDRGCSHTNPYLYDVKPWWYVSLSEENLFIISNVSIYNRLGLHADRLQQLLLLLGNNTSGNPDLSTWSTCANHSAQLGPVTTFSCSDAVASRVAVMLDYVPSMLTLCEVIVTGYQYTSCNKPSHTGPGCLLQRCDSGACRAVAGTCGLHSACVFPRCPEDRHWPPECWIKMPILIQHSTSASATCDTVTVKLPEITSSNVEASSVVLEISSPDRPSTSSRQTFFVNASYVTGQLVALPALSGTTYNLIFRPEACIGGKCNFGPASKTIVIATAKREVRYISNGTCGHFSLNATGEGCEAIRSSEIKCVTSDEARVITANGTILCGIENGTEYRCSITVVNSRNLTEVYSHIISSTVGQDTITRTALGAVLGCAAVAVVLAVVLIIMKRRRLRDAKAGTTSIDMTEVQQCLVADVHSANEVIYENLGDMGLAEFERLVKDEAAVLRRFQEQSSNELYPAIVGKAPEHKTKNRFQNILPYDKNRVVLLGPLADSFGYINASYVDGFTKAKSYIATQGPIAKTVDDFWNMVWQENSFVIVMLTNYIERAKKKCEVYFPKSPSDGSDIRVSIGSSQKFETHVITSLELQKGKQSRLLHHYQFLAWPDQAVPQHYAELLVFLKTVNSSSVVSKTASCGPMIVHCSAGVGRTGAFIALDYLLQRYQSEGRINVDGCVLRLREQRMLMVQTKEQYLFVHLILLHAIRTAGFLVDAKQLDVLCSKMNNAPVGAENGISKEWQILQQCRISPAPPKLGARIGNSRTSQSTDVRLSVRNIVQPAYCKSCYSSEGFLPMALPLSSAVNEFWRTIYECNVSCIILLHALPTDQALPQYWPDDGAILTADSLVISTIGSEAFLNNSYTKFDLQVYPSLKKTQQDTKLVSMFILNVWGCEEDTPRNPWQFLKLMHSVSDYCGEHDNRPVAVQCQDGVGHCGLFISAMNALCQMMATGLVQVFQSVEMVRSCHPLFVKNMAQYAFIYKVLKLHNDAQNNYSNC